MFLKIKVSIIFKFRKDQNTSYNCSNTTPRTLTVKKKKKTPRTWKISLWYLHKVPILAMPRVVSMTFYTKFIFFTYIFVIS